MDEHKASGYAADYNQSFSLSYKMPLNLIPIFDWVTTDANFNSSYKWDSGHRP